MNLFDNGIQFLRLLRIVDDGCFVRQICIIYSFCLSFFGVEPLSVNAIVETGKQSFCVVDL